ncbi:MAG: lysine--tRNA ligase [Promethearchaeota archaeon]
MSEKFPAHWLQLIIDKILKRDVSEITLATGKTPSGHIHIGILREIILCDSLRRIFEEKGYKVNFLFFLDDLDAAKRFPDYIDNKFQKDHLGKPFALIPCPFKDCGCKSYAYHFGSELLSTFKDFGIKNEIIWTHKLYKKKKMQKKIKISLENTENIKTILKKSILPTLDNSRKETFLEMQKIWMPVMAICEKCYKIQFRNRNGSIKPNRVLKYNKDKQTVIYECPACGYKGELSVYSGKLKLNWRIDWPAKWAIFKTTCEPAGKDHCVKGGSYDTGLELCYKIFGYKGPVKLAYEWLRLGDFDMKTSKGIIFTPKKYLEIADPELFRMLILRTNPMKHISLRIEEIPQYYDYYDRMEDIYFHIDKADTNEENEFYCFIYPLTKINGIPNEKPKRFSPKLLIFLSQIQNILSLEKLYEKAKSITKHQNSENFITINEFDFLLKRTKNWIEEVKKIIESEKDDKIKKKILQKVSIFTVPNTIDKNIIGKLDKKQLNALRLLRKYISETEELDADSIQNKIFTIAKEELNIPPKNMFEAIYQIIIGKKSGPRLGPFLSLFEKEWLLDRLNFN